jgi:sporulation protein YlmC with PRC-barrel domain
MTEFDVRTLTGATVVDTGGDEIGKVGQVYLDDTSGQPEWVTVKTGLFGTRRASCRWPRPASTATPSSWTRARTR